MEEIWRDIPNFEGIYQVSSLGNVRVLDRYVNSAIKNKKLQKIFRTNIDNSIIEQLSKISV